MGKISFCEAVTETMKNEIREWARAHSVKPMKNAIGEWARAS